jgi:biopolymer transport protein ExbD
MKVNLESSSDDAQIQIVPLIDVIFCILTFFILAALQLTRQQGIGLELPNSQTSTVFMQDTLVISIDSNGQTFLTNQGQRQLIDRSQLFQVAQAYHQQNRDGLLVIEASQTAFYNDVVQVLDIMRQVAPDRVALSTASNNQPGQQQQQPGQLPLPGTSPQLTPAPLVPNPSAPTNTLPTTPGAPVQPAPSNLTPQQPTAPGTTVTPNPGVAPQPVTPGTGVQPPQ